MVRLTDCKVDGQDISFHLRDCETAVANCIRRTVISETAIVAVKRESISFSTDDANINTCSLHDEFLRQRLAFVRVNIDPEIHHEIKLFICDPSDTTLPFTNRTDEIIQYRSRDMLVSRSDVFYPEADVKKIFITNDLITSLKPGQSIKTSISLDLRPVKLTESSDYAFQASHVTFGFRTPMHDPTSSLTPNGSGKSKKVAKSHKAQSEVQPGDKSSSVENQDNVLFRIQSMTPDDEQKYYGYEKKCPETFMFKVSGFGSEFFTGYLVVVKGTRRIIQRLEEIRSGVENLRTDNNMQTPGDDPEIMPQKRIIRKTPDNDLPNSFLFRIEDADHTIGNLISSRLRNIVSTEIQDPENLVAYCKTHPLEMKIDIKFKLTQRHSTRHEEYLATSIDTLIDEFQDFSNQLESHDPQASSNSPS